MRAVDREAVFRDLAAARAGVADLLRQVDLGAWVNGKTGRRVVDVAAHVAQWEEYASMCLEAFAAGGEFRLPPPFEIDAVNQRIFEQHNERSPEDVLAFLASSRQRLLRAAGLIPFGRWAGPVTFPWGARGSVDELLIDMMEHDKHHEAQVRKATGLSQGRSALGA